MKPSLFDLRFVIGLFFLIIGLIVIIASFGESKIVDGSQINLYAGIVFIVFAGGMLLSFRASQKSDS
ncbi:hypothetical protein [Arsenicibacter rosenii]|uniref:Uncharacterized protein n=1 Tax=Arsenicibacter rosenii TaxID=1750698 RepID=A0A1S2VCM6_9BACT|nr:hypothetical protein [Arsenicibacter rosenii]OIN56481.1 hypothetical protein BLX24_24490 [Arsenicibacter rosenii]